ncbi:zinc finger MYM-type protein 1 [Microcaecilia unicolor]|uniref:Zinc finger MYM-type protein 1-like n=1 Tax=Microcaecilia unicolor TaxID=1415580 RepID=A0A6P7Z9G5_9AMPH|nr:zinc finger MYM-type protein 1-like [Microcaecilia unicolor]XP_030072333.1 zinc finger MYM-type protein 1-like [Microcaecilia unicolor]XP_030072334.1 zinc finger MYM-type protein 1-like [Microcaecilia unicolor]
MAKQISLLNYVNKPCLEKLDKDANRDEKMRLEEIGEDAYTVEDLHLEVIDEDACKVEKPHLEELGENAYRIEKLCAEEFGEDAYRVEKLHVEELGEDAYRDEKPCVEELGEDTYKNEKPCVEGLGEDTYKDKKPCVEELGEDAYKDKKTCVEELGEGASRLDSLAFPSTSSIECLQMSTSGTEPTQLSIDLSHIDEPPKQPKLQAFPVSVISGKSRSFSTRWYDKFHWLEYSMIQDAVFCKMCRHFSDARAEGAFTRTGFKDWKHMNRSCARHEMSKSHSLALGRFDDYKHNHLLGVQENTSNPVNQPTKNTPVIESNREHIKVVLDVVMFCAKQDIPLRGHRETDGAVNKGNFLEMFKLLSKYNNDIQNRIEKLPKNATLMSPHIQNELLESATLVLLRKIKSEIHDSNNTYYAVLGVECKDLSKCELVAICIRYLYKGVIKERAVGFVDTADTTANGISDKIIKVLEIFELDPELCVGFSFDGTSVMSGNQGDVHAVLKRTFRRAIYVHSNSHRLNLVLCTASKACPSANTFFEILNYLHDFMTDTHRHSRFLDVQKQLHPDRQCLELEQLTDTKWSSKSGSVKKVLMLFDVILEVLVEFANSAGQIKLESQSILYQIETKKFLFLAVTFRKLFEISDFGTKGLQSTTVSVMDCINLIECLKETFVQFRENTSNDFDKILKLTEELAEKYGIENWDVSSSRKRKLPAKIGDTFVFSTLGKSSRVQSNEDLRHLWNEIIDCQITELNNRFQDDAYGMMTASAACMPASEAFGRRESLQPPCTLYGITIEEAEFTVFVQQLKRKVAQGNTYTALTDVLESCNVDIFPNVNALLRAVITLPMITCNMEKLFSTANRIKTTIRASMLTSRLQNLALLSFERELCDSLDYDSIIDTFNSKRRRLVL